MLCLATGTRCLAFATRPREHPYRKDIMKFVPHLALALALCSACLTDAAAQVASTSQPTVPGAPAQVAAPLTKGAFVLFEYDVKDPAVFKKVTNDTQASLRDFKGEFAMREKVQSLFGGAPTNLSVISFPSIADARAWLASPGRAGLQPERDKAATVRSYLVEKLD